MKHARKMFALSYTFDPEPKLFFFLKLVMLLFKLKEIKNELKF